MTDLTTAVQNQANDMHTAINMVLDKSSELHKERQRSEQLYSMCENLWQMLNVVSWEYKEYILHNHMAAIKESLETNNPSKLKAND